MLPSLLFLIAPFKSGALALASEPPLSRRTHERRSNLPPSWAEHADPHPLTPVPLRIALTQSNLDVANDQLLRVSNPDSPDFASHWTAKEVAEFFAPSEESVAAVVEWLSTEGIDRTRLKQSQSLGWLEVANATVSEAERLLDTEYNLYKHPSGRSYLGCRQYSVPEHVSKHVDFITPTLHFDVRVHDQGRKHKRAVEPGSPQQGNVVSSIITELEQCGPQITPMCLRALYNIPFDSQRATSNNSFGIAEYTPQAYLPADLDMFFGKFLTTAVGNRPTMDSVDGGVIQTVNQSLQYNGESDLDLQYAMALVYPLNPVLYQTGDLVEDIEGTFNNFLDALDASYCTYQGGDNHTLDGVYPDPHGGGYEGPENCGGYTAAKVISTSYQYNEVDLTPFYEERQCHEYLKLGLQGVTVLYSSGDGGVAGAIGECLTPDGSYSPTGTVFNPTFPGTCPYITSVGATQIKPNGTVLQAEQACETVIYSSGGFSNRFAMPSYQRRALEAYYAAHAPPYTSAQYNNSRKTRGFPDVAANGANYVVAIDAAFQIVQGTSAATPTVGAIIALVNDARLAVGKKSVGFVNPMLYAYPELLNDITTGGNPGCGTPGFSAVPGWDPVTGLGTPDYLKLVAKYLTLP